ncbi:carboxymuconolactone decarboxylase family protein [Aureimonas altamirensis]|uniref:carboxymuconolactone decarboxylase family protein n=1 Tax=Aureimonas altamirensis TaxID=370622 RepID=UPI001E44AD43|nr:carboxymuconolactone decarboxylase family protein [Aureimonas altamirensis]UHD44560.1 carboxymuconolactone decarboxylase family protein [Aureimonas altamirensis]
MAVVPLLGDGDAAPEAVAVFDEIRERRGTDYVNNFWRALAHDPVELRDVWDSIDRVMAAGALDPLTKELIYIAVSTAHGCSYCVHSHTAGARAKGLTPEMHRELLAVIALASRTNALATSLGVPVDERFDASDR